MNVRRGIGIKSAYFTAAMEADSFPPQAPATTGKASATESGERDLFANTATDIHLVAGPGCTQMNVRRGIVIKAAYFTTAMEADSFPPQAPATTGKASATESGERDLFAESDRK